MPCNLKLNGGVKTRRCGLMILAVLVELGVNNIDLVFMGQEYCGGQLNV
jgi:hypothetical protein